MLAQLRRRELGHAEVEHAHQPRTIHLRRHGRVQFESEERHRLVEGLVVLGRVERQVAQRVQSTCECTMSVKVSPCVFLSVCANIIVCVRLMGGAAALQPKSGVPPSATLYAAMATGFYYSQKITAFFANQRPQD